MKNRLDYDEDLFIRAFKEELRLINKHLPYKRINLCELLRMDPPYVVLRDGTISLIDWRELESLKNLLGEEACNLYLPIIIEYDPSKGESAYIVKDEASAKALSKLLGIDYSGGELIIYRPQLYIVRTKLRTTTTIVFIPR